MQHAVARLDDDLRSAATFAVITRFVFLMMLLAMTMARRPIWRIGGHRVEAEHQHTAEQVLNNDVRGMRHHSRSRRAR